MRQESIRAKTAAEKVHNVFTELKKNRQETRNAKMFVIQ